MSFFLLDNQPGTVNYFFKHNKTSKTLIMLDEKYYPKLTCYQQ